MESQFTKENVIDALDKLSKGSDRSADRFLRSFQNSVTAWDVAEEILSDFSHQPMHIQTFAAISLSKKIQYDICLLTMYDSDVLRGRLVNHLLNAAKIPGSNTLIVQLAKCLSILVLMNPHWLEELGAFVQLMSGEPDYIMALLEVLRVLPEEANAPNFRPAEVVLEHLRRTSSYILKVVEEIHERMERSKGFANKCLAVCGSWTSNGFLSPDRVLDSFLFPWSFAVLSTPIAEGHFESAELMVALLEQCLVHKNPDKLLFTMLISLKPAFERSMGDSEKLQNYCHIFVNLFETHYLLTKRDALKIQERLEIIELLLLIATHCPILVIETSMRTWCLFSADLFDQSNSELNTLYRPYFVQLIKILFSRARIQANNEGKILPSPMNRFRSLLAELLADVAHLIEHETIRELNAIATNEQSHWSDVEMAIFFLKHLKNLENL
ncbi:importin-13 [Drosophila ficusphila]|uniref:importin-13 n=1 Tax=Drosophila ficusphila TaxID=30025 RepID=UPI0007E66A50|nr:importin-13 [Drosophila ficusphila]